MSPGSLSRRSSVYGSHETLPNPRTPVPPAGPSSSRNPEQNWLLTSAPPKFSRLGLKGEGVVLPLTAKEVRRRSTIRVSSQDGADTRSITGTLRSRRSQASFAASAIAEDESDVRPPAPAFRRDASASSASVASTASAESDVQTTPSLSRASSESGGSADADEVRTPREPDVAEFGVLPPKDASPAGVELRVNDVTVEIIDLNEKAERVRAPARVAADAPAKNVEKAVPVRRGTLKRVWKKLTGGKG